MGHLGPASDHLGPFCSHLGIILGDLGQSSVILGTFWEFLRNDSRFWVIVLRFLGFGGGHLFGNLGRIFGQPGVLNLLGDLRL